MRILLIEDDSSLASAMLTALRGLGYAVDHASRGKEGLQLLRTNLADVVILDLGLPDIDGTEVLKTIRIEKNDTPVLVLTARDSIDDKVLGLDAGADDYLTKPFDFDELMARIRVLARRRTGAVSSEINQGKLTINTAAHQASFAGESITLSRREFALLSTLAERPGQVFSREQLEDKLYAWGDEVASNTVDVHIHNLRKKMGSGLIKTIRGVGYTLGDCE